MVHGVVVEGEYPFLPRPRRLSYSQMAGLFAQEPTPPDGHMKGLTRVNPVWNFSESREGKNSYLQTVPPARKSPLRHVNNLELPVEPSNPESSPRHTAKSTVKKNKHSFLDPRGPTESPAPAKHAPTEPPRPNGPGQTLCLEASQGSFRHLDQQPPGIITLHNATRNQDPFRPKPNRF